MTVHSRIGHVAWLCVAILSLFAVEARAQCRLEGTVLSAAGAPLADASVVVTGSELRAPLITRTDRNGHYAFENVKAGIRVRVTVVASGRPAAVEYGLITERIETMDIKFPAAIEAPTSADDLDPAGGASGEVRGIVRAADGSPIAGARVYIADTPVATATDSFGRFTFGRVRAGLSVQLRVIAEGFETAIDQVSVPGQGAADAEFSLAAPRTSEQSPAQPILSDLARTARFLSPRSTTSDSQAVTYDGFHWYPFSRMFLDLGGLHPEPIAGIHPGGQATGAVEVSAFGTAGRVNVPVSRRGSLLVAARRSLPGTLYGEVLDAFAGGTGTAVRDRAPRGSSTVFPLPPAPGYADVNARLQLTPGRNNRLSVSFYDARDNENYSRDQPAGTQSTDIAVPAAFQLPSETRIEAGDAQNWKGRGFSASWARDWSPVVTTTASVAESRFSKTHEQGFFLTNPLTGADYAVPAGRETSSGLFEENKIRDTTVRVGASLRAGFRHAIDVNGEIGTLEAEANALIEAVRPTDAATRGATVMVPLLQRSTIGKVITVSAQDIWRPVGRLVVAPAVRLIHYDIAGSTYADPRVTVSYPVAPRVEANASWSIDHQIATRVTREDREHGDGDFWILADGLEVPVVRVQQFAGGFSVDGPGVRFEAHLGYKRLDHVTLFASRGLPGVAPIAATTVFHQGSGTAVGLELALEQQSRRNGLRAIYTLGRSEYSYPTLEAGTFSDSDDEGHHLRIVDTVPIRAGWSVGAAFVAAQGRPLTPLQTVQQVWFPSGDLAYQALFGPRNSARLPPYHRLDLSTRVDRRVRALSSTLGVTVFNVYNRDNILFYDDQTVGSAMSASPIVMMHRAVNVFFKVGF